MVINHLNLTVSNILEASQFFQTYLGFKAADTKPNDSLAVLNGPDDFLLVLMHNRFNESGLSAYPDAFHIGFYLPDQAAVHHTWQQLHEGGIPLPQQPQKIRKTFGFYFHYDNIMIEITTASNN
ncbi:VOC family protein [Chitinophaga qingshengii]|uniref:VOC family protein n=1 Tax=Chitinophaga qingshengii TaxID=1569794 RepID=A0ABR7TWY9_9BACT|nr:VOC family protein [Chitinophaga qingshengii]MBC9934518.1 VOC family protein [Chitinophaga qingshengii]